MERSQDLALGLLFAGLGLAAAWQAGSYQGAGGTYPMVLGLGLALCGALVMLRAARSKTDAPRRLVDVPANLVKALAAGVIYVALILPLGFYTASALLMLALPPVLGFRRPLYTAVVAASFVALVWIVFSLVLNKPLPAELWAASRLGG
ncbi:tripartite tricarboxylate transporter TctB family protein [Stappia sp. WLB 29]|uniref:tripartite tricarboxylate transporter TctB family protein n=1 Tax=Stappia sp. WLB 29 TaxID=2925220 RepID=UPI0020C0B2B2|nr:tripartite tricarboxylate transporter TctB family protein [Stappia sp. WLB 29]